MTKEKIVEEETGGIFDERELAITGLANAMEIYAKQQYIEFFKWYGIKMVSLTTYLLEIKPLVRSEEMEEKIAEFEGQSLDNLYNLFLQYQSNKINNET